MHACLVIRRYVDPCRREYYSRRVRLEYFLGKSHAHLFTEGARGSSRRPCHNISSRFDLGYDLRASYGSCTASRPAKVQAAHNCPGAHLTWSWITYDCMCRDVNIYVYQPMGIMRGDGRWPRQHVAPMITEYALLEPLQHNHATVLSVISSAFWNLRGQNPNYCTFIFSSSDDRPIIMMVINS